MRTIMSRLTRRLSAAAPAVVAFLALASLPMAAPAAVYEIWPGASLGAAISNLQPGDTLILHAGDYARTWTGQFKGGTEGNWITIKGADGEPRPRIVYNGVDRNVFDLSGAAYIKFENLEIYGGSDAFKIQGTCHDITIENVYMHHLGSGGVNCSGITELYNLTVRDCEIAYTSYGTWTPGEGFYLGGHGKYNQPQVHDSLIERCYIHNIGGSQGDGIELKHGCHRVVIQDCVIQASAPGNYPGITAWGTYKNNPSYNNIIRRNLVYSSADAGIHVTGEVNIENNIVVNSLSRGIHCRRRDYDGVMRDTRIVNNTIYNAGGAALHLVNWDVGTNLVLANNVIYQASPDAQAINALNPLSAATVVKNLYYGVSNEVNRGLVAGPAPAEIFINPSTTLGTMDLAPLAGGQLIDAGDNTYVPTLDFNNVAVWQGAAADIGAYESTGATNLGWPLAATFKQVGVPGDINLDGHVNAIDLLRLANAFATSSGDPNYDPDADINGDGIINVIDLLMLAHVFGQF